MGCTRSDCLPSTNTSSSVRKIVSPLSSILCHIISDNLSVRGYNCAQIFVTAEYRIKTCPMNCTIVGVPNSVFNDSAGDKLCKKDSILQKRTESHSPGKMKQN
jgi:hypothetical protein